jgi:hypothetical protein
MLDVAGERPAGGVGFDADAEVDQFGVGEVQWHCPAQGWRAHITARRERDSPRRRRRVQRPYPAVLRRRVRQNVYVGENAAVTRTEAPPGGGPTATRRPRRLGVSQPRTGSASRDPHMTTTPRSLTPDGNGPTAAGR